MTKQVYWCWISGIIAVLYLGLSVPLALAAPKAEAIPGWEVYSPSSTVEVDHQPLDRFLQTYRTVDPTHIAHIAYDQVTSEDQKRLKAYVDRLQTVSVEALDRDQQFAFWVNLYNSATLFLILKHHPENSIRDINISPGFFSTGPWGKQFLTVSAKSLSLDNIEHGILRPLWKDPRTHYVINCASIGCPDIPETAIRAKDLSLQLDHAAKAFINHPRGVRLNDDGSATLSKIYDWFREDFGESDADILNHLRAFAAPEKRNLLEKVTKISGYRYDWSLNGTGSLGGK